MHLINCHTLQLEYFIGSKIPPYAILSHTWDDEEVLFAEFTQNHAVAAKKAGYKKIRFACEQALRDRLDYAWVDTCCIDKSSSAELSEAINSMFAWYADAEQCYVYLSDVENSRHGIMESRWLTRGWTLQELIAPSEVSFFDEAWRELGTRSFHAQSLAEATWIDIDLLDRMPMSTVSSLLKRYSVAQKMAWASRRLTTRLEDTAYCMFGLFDIQMPLLYGEGNRAFERLQKEILKEYNDDSILAWDLCMDPNTRHDPEYRGKGAIRWLLAQSPTEFLGCRDVVRYEGLRSDFKLTAQGVQIQLTLLKPEALENTHERVYIGLLNCSRQGRMIGIGLTVQNDPNESHSLAYRCCIFKPESERGLRTSMTLNGKDIQERHVSTMAIHAYFMESRRFVDRGKRMDNQFCILHVSGDWSFNPGFTVTNTAVWSLRDGVQLRPIWDDRNQALTVFGSYDLEQCVIALTCRSHKKENNYFTVVMRGTEMTAFVVDKQVDIDPDWEIYFRMRKGKTATVRFSKNQLSHWHVYDIRISPS